MITRLLISFCLALSLGACTALAPVNDPISTINPDTGYRVMRYNSKSMGEDFMSLSFSGGGMRAAALSYGVLEELRRVKIPYQGQFYTLLDGVDLISGVSGGSFTALAYALHGKNLFGLYENQFLKRDVQSELLLRTINPKYWPDLGSTYYGRSELAEDYYDEILFGGATYADLLKLPDRPLAIVNATDLSTGARIGFMQEDFDLMCSNLSTMRLSRAAAASSAVPVVLSPVTLKNYGGSCGWQPPPWIAEMEKPDTKIRPAGRALLRYQEQKSLQDSKSRPYIHLVDGGISDNIGLRGLIDNLELLEASADFRKAIEFDKRKNFVSITVNSRSAPSTNWDKSPTPPGFISQLLQSSSVPIDHYSYETVELLKDMVQRMNLKREAEITKLQLLGKSKEEAERLIPQLNFFPIDVSFDNIKDPKERAYFMELPTTWALSEEQIDRLRELGGRLLRESKTYQDLLKLITSVTEAKP